MDICYFRAYFVCRDPAYVSPAKWNEKLAGYWHPEWHQSEDTECYSLIKDPWSGSDYRSGPFFSRVSKTIRIFLVLMCFLCILVNRVLTRKNNTWRRRIRRRIRRRKRTLPRICILCLQTGKLDLSCIFRVLLFYSNLQCI